VELVENRFNTQVGSDTLKLKEAFRFFKTKRSDFSIELYGKGHDSELAGQEISRKQFPTLHNK
jgi:hypothetical protein